MQLRDEASRHRRSPTSQELRVWRAFVETSERVRAELASKMQAESALSTADYGVLLALSEAADRRMRSSDLAAHLRWERSRLSHHLGRMESRGLVTRERCATDNRGADVVLSEDGASRFRRASSPHLRDIHALFVEALSSQQLSQLDAIMSTLDTHLDETSGLRRTP